MTLVPPPGRTATFHFPCYPMTGRKTRDQLDITLSLPITTGVPLLTWAELVPDLLVWITRVAKAENGYRFPEMIQNTKLGDPYYGHMSVRLNDIAAIT